MSSPVRYSTSPAPWVPGALLYQAECLPILHSLAPESISAVITDPPYGLSDVGSAEVIQAITAWASGDRERVPNGKGFMGNEWDRFVPPPAVWDECYRALKPGGYMAVFAGSRTADLMGLSIRLAGFEKRDTITWMYGSGFPKSLDVGKAIDKAAGAVREVIGEKSAGQSSLQRVNRVEQGYRPNLTACTPESIDIIAPATDAAKQWDGWGTALKPAVEPIIVARKPFKGTVAQNVLIHGTGGMNIDGCRVATMDDLNGGAYSANGRAAPMSGDQRIGAALGMFAPGQAAHTDYQQPNGRWPPNLVLSHASTADGEDACADGCVPGCPVAELDTQSGTLKSGDGVKTKGFDDSPVYGTGNANYISENRSYADSGGASRFYPVFRYQAKAPRSERTVVNGVAHPTVKPLALMEWLVTLFTPPYGVVLDPFAGSGTTGHAGLKLGFNSIMVERATEYKPLIDKRLNDYLATLAAKTPA